ncbi:MAG: helix-turn-helix domain-containing protein [Thermoleophilaceae bacterium]|jgi:excisionase family DNA binding protein
MDKRPLYVRLPTDAAEKLDRAAFELRTSKQDLVAELVQSHLPLASTRRVVVESMDDTLTVGHHSFVPSEALEVLTAAEAAALLRTDDDTVEKMAESGELPGRKIGDEWRFARSAVLRWLAGDDEEES